MNKVLEYIGVVALLSLAGVLFFYLADVGAIGKAATAIQVMKDASSFVVLYVAATLLTAYLVVVANIKFVYRFIAIPLWLAFSLSLLVAIDDFLGYAYPDMPEEGELIHYVVLHEKGTKHKWVELWLYHREENRTRLYSIPYTPKTDEELNRGMKMKEEGERVKVKKKVGSRTTSGALELHKIPYSRPDSKD